jgi:hypothetical protein
MSMPNKVTREQSETFEKFKKHHNEKYQKLDDEFSEFAKKANQLNITGSGYSESSLSMIESKNDLANLIRSRAR